MTIVIVLTIVIYHYSSIVMVENFTIAHLYNHTYVISCGTGKILSKKAGNSASKPLNSTPNESPCITVEW